MCSAPGGRVCVSTVSLSPPPTLLRLHGTWQVFAPRKSAALSGGDMALWNAMIAAAARCGQMARAEELLAELEAAAEATAQRQAGTGEGRVVAGEIVVKGREMEGKTQEGAGVSPSDGMASSSRRAGSPAGTFHHTWHRLGGNSSPLPDRKGADVGTWESAGRQKGGRRTIRSKQEDRSVAARGGRKASDGDRSAAGWDSGRKPDIPLEDRNCVSDSDRSARHQHGAGSRQAGSRLPGRQATGAVVGPTLSSYNALLMGYSRAGDIAMAERTLQARERTGDWEG